MIVVILVSPSAASTQVVSNGGKRKQTTGATTIVQLPLAFVRSGWTNVSTEYEGAMRYVGGSGYEWSRTANSSTAVYRLGFSSTGLGMNAEDRYWGFSLR